MSLYQETLSGLLGNQSALTHQYCMLCEELTNTNFIVFGLN